MTQRWEEPEHWFHNKATDYVVAQIMFHLNQVGVFRMLAEQTDWVSSTVISERLSLDQRILHVLLSYISAVDEIVEENENEAFQLSSFGRKVIQRYGKMTTNGMHINMFDVRVGAYGPVWEALDGLAKGTKKYGQEIIRSGTFAERGLYATARGMGPSLMEAIEPGCTTVVELGVETGLLEYVGQRRPDIQLMGLDRNEEALAKCCEQATREGITGIVPIRANLFDVAEWAGKLTGLPPGVIYTIHMHEFMAAGRTQVVELVDLMIRSLPGWKLVFFEQPKPCRGDKAEMKESIWLAAHSNILIHHLIKNGRILPRTAWQTIMVEAGGTVSDVTQTGYLNYERYTVQL